MGEKRDGVDNGEDYDVEFWLESRKFCRDSADAVSRGEVSTGKQVTMEGTRNSRVGEADVRRCAEERGSYREKTHLYEVRNVLGWVFV